MQSEPGYRHFATLISESIFDHLMLIVAGYRAVEGLAISIWEMVEVDFHLSRSTLGRDQITGP